MAFFVPYGIHAEIWLNATPVRRPRAAFESRGGRAPGFKCSPNLHRAWHGGVAATAPPLPAAKPHRGSACAGLSRYRRHFPASKKAARFDIQLLDALWLQGELTGGKVTVVGSYIPEDFKGAFVNQAERAGKQT